MTSISEMQFMEILGARMPLFGEGSALATLLTKELVPGAASTQGANLGEVAWPFSRSGCLTWMTLNEYHAACIDTAVACIVGLGFELPSEQKERAQPTDPLAPASAAPPPKKNPAERSKVSETLDPLCDGSFQEVITDVTTDVVNTGNGALEVVRQQRGNQNSPVAALYHIPIPTIGKWIEGTDGAYHYVVHPTETVDGFGDVHMRVFASERAAPRGMSIGESRQLNSSDMPTEEASEVIFFRRPTPLSRHYGWPHWLGAVPSIELYKSLTQHLFDFFNNRGVPELLVLFMGKKIPDPEWKKITESLKQHRGLGNAFKSMALNIQDEAMKVQVEKLADETGPEGIIGELSDVLAA
ncbi:MAG: hypothetical protein AAB131_12200, partial [Actinomycetota bacterium]